MQLYMNGQPVAVMRLIIKGHRNVVTTKRNTKDIYSTLLLQLGQLRPKIKASKEALCADVTKHFILLTPAKHLQVLAKL